MQQHHPTWQLHELLTTTEGSVSQIVESWRDNDFSERGTAEKGFLANSPELWREPEIDQGHTVKEGGLPCH